MHSLFGRVPPLGADPGVRPKSSIGHRPGGSGGNGVGLTGEIFVIIIYFGEQVRLKAGPQMLVSERTGIPSPAAFFCLTTAPLLFGQAYLQQHR